MTREESIQRQRDAKAWRETEIGRLFERYAAAAGNAWITDQTSHSTARMRAAWEKADAAKAEFLDVVCALAGIPNPYAKPTRTENGG